MVRGKRKMVVHQRYLGMGFYVYIKAGHQLYTLFYDIGVKLKTNEIFLEKGENF